MKIAIHSPKTNCSTLEAVLDEVRQTEAAGLAGYWAPMLNGIDTLTALGIAAGMSSKLDLGTAVVPIPLRSPYALAQQALTVQEAAQGRFILGLGTSHRAMVDAYFGTPWKSPLATMRSYLEELLPLLDGAATDRLRPRLRRPQVLLGAVNPRMAALAGEFADGIVTWAAGVRTMDEIMPIALAARPGAQSMRVVAALPVCVTDNADQARIRIRSAVGGGDNLPSYRRVLDREGVGGLAELSIVGDESAVGRQLERLASAGVTDFAARIIASGGDAARTWTYLAQLASTEHDLRPR